MSHYDYRFKVILLGFSGVGKSSILTKYTQDVFYETTQSTIGTDFQGKDVQIRKGNKTYNIRLTIWDTAGQERFQSFSKSFYRVAHAVIFVYDITNADSFRKIRTWLEQTEENTTYPNIVKLLVGNKTDLEEHRQISKEEGYNFAKEEGMMFMETSARTSEGIQQAFEEITHKILESDSLSETGKTIHTGVADSMQVNEETEENQGGCCY